MGRELFHGLERDLVKALTGAGYSQRAALVLIGLSRGSWHRRRNPPPPAPEPVPHTRRRASSWLTPTETAAIITVLQVAFGAGKSVWQSFYEALDAGTPIASISSWYRIARAHLGGQRPERGRRRRGRAVLPQWDATAAMQIWSWDITKLKGPYTRTWYEFYVVIDVFSRKIVGWRVEEREDEDLAEEMFLTAIGDHDGIVPSIVHSDGGSVMTSKTLAELFRDLHIRLSRNRPRVSNDNPYSEAWFKTAKYRPGYPAFFSDIDTARAWAGDLVTWYNLEHRHSALEGHTPASVHDGTWQQIHSARQATMDALAAAHPDRYRKPIQVRTPYAHVVLNTEKSKDRLTTG